MIQGRGVHPAPMAAGRARSLATLSVAVLALALVPLALSSGPLGPLHGAFSAGAGGFPEDVLDAAADCTGGFAVGAATRDITPGVKRPDGTYDLWQEPYVDANGNGRYDAPSPFEPDGASDPYTDANHNGKWDGPFMAGYGHNDDYYTARTVHDPVWARAVALSCGDLLVGLASVDTVGLFQHVVWAIRDHAAAAGYDHIVVASTHTHDSVDTMGLWGPNELTDGKDPRTISHIINQTGDALLAAAADLRPAALQGGGHSTFDPHIVAGAGYVQTDLRDPFVIDDQVYAARFVGNGTIATIVNWSPHPETLAGTVGEISSDFVDRLRRSIETEGATVGGVAHDALGGTAVYFSGAVGGMMTTLGARVHDEEGNPLPDRSYAKSDRIGEAGAWAAMEGLAAAAPREVGSLRVQVREVTFPIDNVFLAALNTLNILDHPVALGPATVGPIGNTGLVPPIPFLRTELDVVTLFDTAGEPVVQIATTPGELLPEIGIGGFLTGGGDATMQACYDFDPLKLLVDGTRHSNYNETSGVREPGWKRVLAAHADAPTEAVIRDRMTAPVPMIFGLANDELGYIVPAHDFIHAAPFWDGSPYVEATDRCGDDDHYEETVSASSVLAPVVANNLAHMLDPTYTPPAYPARMGGTLGDPAGVADVLEGEPVGIWLDTSGSNGYEEEEDTHLQVSLPSYLSGAWGFLDGDGRDQGEAPDEETGGLWIDLDGDGAYGPEDGVVFIDHWALQG